MQTGFPFTSNVFVKAYSLGVLSRSYFLCLASWNINIGKRMEGDLACIHRQTFPFVATDRRESLESTDQVREPVNYCFTVYRAHV